MQILINGKPAALKKGTSFEYVSENRLFSGSDGYSLTINFPLKDCPQNLAIFGHINRRDVSVGKLIFDCEIRDKNFYKSGCITITEINDAEIKAQFLDGRSELNFENTLDDIFINELELGSAPTTTTNISIIKAWGGYSVGMNAVALPWVNDASGNIQNKANYNESSRAFSWDAKTSGLSWQPYLLHITEKICEAIGYSYDFSAWRAKEEYRFLLICNCLPYTWFMPEFARSLPHWSVNEFFSKLELFLGCEFNFDHRAKSVSFAFSKDILQEKPVIMLDKVLIEHTTEAKVKTDNCNYSEMKNLFYKECSHNMWKFYSCDWFIKAKRERALKYETLSQLLAANKGLASWNGFSQRGSNRDKLLYAADCNRYFVVRAVSREKVGTNNFGYAIFKYKCVLQPVNALGGRIVDESDDAPQEEIDFVPAWIDYTDDTFGNCLFLPSSSYDEEGATTYDRGTSYNGDIEAYRKAQEAVFHNSLMISALEAGESNKKSEYFDRIYIGWWDGAMMPDGKYPHPWADNLYIQDDWSNYSKLHFSMRLNDAVVNKTRIVHDIEPNQKTTFKFLADNVPDVRAVFIIRGKRYISEKLTISFSENGMSQLIKGVFYPLK